jgi:hypothetical protein
LTPAEVFEYKQRWKPGFADQGKTFCKRQCDRHEWSCTTWTDNYEHTFHFEHNESAQKFKIAMGKFADQ